MRSSLPLLLLALVLPLAPSSAAQERRLTPAGIESLAEIGVDVPISWPADIAARHAAVRPEPTAAPRSAPWPTNGWLTSTPQAEGMDPQVLVQALQYAVGEGSKGVLVVRNGYIVGEWYGQGWDQDTQQRGWSIAKSFTSALVGMLIEDGMIGSVNDTVSIHVPE